MVAHSTNQTEFAPELQPLAAGLAQRPGVTAVFQGHMDSDGRWSICFVIDTSSRDAWEEIRRFAWLFNNLYSVVEDDVSFRPVVFEETEHQERRHLCWMLESLSPYYTPDRALDVLLTPLPAFAPPLRGGDVT